MTPAPPTLAGTYVVAWAHADEAVMFVQRKTLSVDGEWLGRVPCLAICQDFETAEYMIQYCDAAWETIGIAAGLASLDEAKRRAELSYAGISERWREPVVSKDEALTAHQAELAAQCCSFCGRTPLQIDMMFGDGARICNFCVQSFSRDLQLDPDGG